MRWDVLKSFALRTVVSGVLAALAFAGDNITDVGTSADNAALITFVLSYVGHAVHAFAAKYGISVPPFGGDQPE